MTIQNILLFLQNMEYQNLLQAEPKTDFEISLSSLPPELQSELKPAIDENGNIQKPILFDALRSHANISKKRIPLSCFDTKLSREFESLDTNSDGYLDFTEIETAVSTLVHHRKRIRDLTLLVLILVASMLLIFGGMVGLVYLVVNLQKVTASYSTTFLKYLTCHHLHRTLRPRTAF